MTGDAAFLSLCQGLSCDARLPGYRLHHITLRILMSLSLMCSSLSLAIGHYPQKVDSEIFCTIHSILVVVYGNIVDCPQRKRGR